MRLRLRPGGVDLRPRFVGSSRLDDGDEGQETWRYAMAETRWGMEQQEVEACWERYECEGPDESGTDMQSAVFAV